MRLVAVPVLLAPSRWRRPSAFTAVLWLAAAGYSAALATGMTPFIEPIYLLRPPGPYTQDVVATAPFWVVPTSAVAMALPIVAARRYMAQVLALVLVEATVMTCLGWKPLPAFAAADVLIFFIVATCSRRAMIMATVIAPVVWAGTAVGIATINPHTPLVDQSRSIDLMLATAVAWVSGFVIRQRRGYGEQLRERAAAQAVTEERLRIARELHDMVAHSIGIIAIQAGAARRCVDTQPEGVRTALTAIETTSRDTLAGLRRMLGALRHADGEGYPSPGLDDVDRLAANAADAGVRVEVEWRGERRPLTPEIDLSAYRIVQEAVTNVVRHAGVDRCRVAIAQAPDEVAIEVVDDGCGAVHESAWRTGGWLGESGVAEGGYGLAGMRERVGLLHGEFSAGPRDGGGFRVAARLPVPSGAR